MKKMKQNDLGILAAIALGGLMSIGQVSRADDTPPPPAPPSVAGNAAPHRAHPGDPVESLTRALDLTPDQQGKLRAIFKDQREKRSVLHADTSLPPETRRSKLKEIDKAADAASKALLTPDQLVKLEKMRQGSRADPPPPGAPSDNK
jgi:hypothetical protein